MGGIQGEVRGITLQTCMYKTAYCTLIAIPTAFLKQDAENGIHVIDRRAKLAVEAPYLLKKIMGVDDLIFRQRNTFGHW